LVVVFCLLAWLIAGSCRQRTPQSIGQTTPTATPFRAVAVTTYRARAEETDDTPCRTADGTEICRRLASAPRICAVSPDLLDPWPFGTTLEISLLGGFWRSECEVHDVTNARFANHVDILIPDGVRPDRFSGHARALQKGAEP
jgi:3D (Asp-Asp-Asp) domain-containing protein